MTLDVENVRGVCSNIKSVFLNQVLSLLTELSRVLLAVELWTFLQNKRDEKNDRNRYNCDVTPTWLDKNRRSSIERYEWATTTTTIKESRSLHSFSTMLINVKSKDLARAHTQTHIPANLMSNMMNWACANCLVRNAQVINSFAWVGSLLPCQNYIENIPFTLVVNVDKRKIT